MVRSQRELNAEITWFAERACWRFKYRDPFTGERKFINANAGKFADLKVALPDPDALRKKTNTSLALARKLQAAFLRSLAAVTPETFNAAAPTLSETIEKYFELYDGQSPGYRTSLRTIFTEFRDVVGDKPVDRVIDEDMKTFERAVAKRASRATVRSYLRQLGMLIHFAVRKGWIRQDPRLTYKPPKDELKEPNPFTRTEIAKFFEVVARPVAGHPKGADYLAWIGSGLLFLGLRPVELQHAQWEDVNFDERFLFIRRSHANKMPQACQNQPIPLAVWPEFLKRRRESGPVWTSYFGDAVTEGVLHRARETLQAAMPGFMWKRFRKSYATILEQAGNDVVSVSRLLRQSAGGKNVTMAQRHYIGKSQRVLRDAVDEAFAGYAANVHHAATGAVAATEAAHE